MPTDDRQFFVPHGFMHSALQFIRVNAVLRAGIIAGIAADTFVLVNRCGTVDEGNGSGRTVFITDTAFCAHSPQNPIHPVYDFMGFSARNIGHVFFILNFIFVFPILFPPPNHTFVIPVIPPVRLPVFKPA